jgi:hypothetical protein
MFWASLSSESCKYEIIGRIKTFKYVNSTLVTTVSEFWFSKVLLTFNIFCTYTDTIRIASVTDVHMLGEDDATLFIVENIFGISK